MKYTSVRYVIFDEANNEFASKSTGRFTWEFGKFDRAKLKLFKNKKMAEYAIQELYSERNSSITRNRSLTLKKVELVCTID